MSSSTVMERPKMTRPMYESLKRHILKERAKRRMEDEAQEAHKRQKELRKRKAAEDSLTLEQTKEQILGIEKRLEEHQQEKHELFNKLKSVLHEDQSRRKAQEQWMSVQMSYAPQGLLPKYPMLINKPSAVYKPPPTQLVQTAPMKRPHTPSPPPTTTPIYQGSPTTSRASLTGSQMKTLSGSPRMLLSSNYASSSAFTSYPNHYAFQQKQSLPRPYLIDNSKGNFMTKGSIISGYPVQPPLFQPDSTQSGSGAPSQRNMPML